ncbi:hypothetical protein [Dolichospermum sp. UHCC 0259]|uniref:hypothetical protein n=1 Tax=Dolichospermum sp. UHCC 0259 TaxID=2590010 RepID=UPI001445EDF6|nr:hypothetical protein [Dolichospermum sp. UHCC 0259]MTJ47688.1 hypothetical protein [Dolichospermum sp. UHCC 0259]
MTKSAAHDVEKIQTGIFILHEVGRSPRDPQESLMKNPKFPMTISYLKDSHLLLLSPVNNRV